MFELFPDENIKMGTLRIHIQKSYALSLVIKKKKKQGLEIYKIHLYFDWNFNIEFQEHKNRWDVMHRKHMNQPTYITSIIIAVCQYKIKQSKYFDKFLIVTLAIEIFFLIFERIC